MKFVAIVILTTILCFVSAQSRFSNIKRSKRDAVGSLDIVTNNVQPIHADVKIDHRIEKPCSKSMVDSKPSQIEPGVVFKVTPPKDTYSSLRRSSPLTTTLDLVRAISRLVTVVVLAVSAAIEFYPILQNVYDSIYELIYMNKF